MSPDVERGDGDRLNICVSSEMPLTRAEVILTARVVGGIQAVDGGEADDKIIAVLCNGNGALVAGYHAKHSGSWGDLK